MKTTWMSIEALERRFGLTAACPSPAFVRLGYLMAGEDVLSTRFKELLALAICIATRRANGISGHLHDALEAGASRQEILEVIEIAVLVGGDKSIRYGAEAVSALGENQAV